VASVVIFSLWMTGGGVKRGFSYGESADFTDNPVKDRIQDFQATAMHLLGIDQERLALNSKSAISA
jgi:hypothetical protein